MPDELTLARIRKWMESYTVTPRMLATAIGYSPSHVRRILQGQRRLLPETHETIITYFTARMQETQKQRMAIAELDRCA